MARQTVDGSFEVTSWSEQPAAVLAGTAKVTVASIGQQFRGGIEAETIADMVMTYREDGTAEFAGYQRVHGRIGDRAGAFVLQSIGGFDGTTARSQLTVVAGSATGALAGLTGTGASEAPTGSTGTFTFDYEL
ncbi:MAG: DUF3224 domain-containing protein [Acidimicrobiales bacterium]